jgi:AraC family transcriptional regulator, arabinose operon regulatory protein
MVINTPAPVFGKLKTGLFRMKENYWTWREKGTGDWLLIYTLSGNGRFGHVHGEFVAGRGDIVLIRPHTRHDYGLEKQLRRWGLLWAHFIPKAEWIPLLTWPEEAQGLMRLKITDEEIRKKIVHRFLEVNQLSMHQDTFAMNALEEVLLWCDMINPQSKTSLLDVRIRRTLDYLYQNFEKPISIPMLAQKSGLSASRFAHLFRQEVGNSPVQFLEVQRINHACRLLELTQYSVSEIGYKVGFQNPFYFSLRFKRQMGVSPRFYREKTISRLKIKMSGKKQLS